ncbi:uncharacterized protein LOC111346792 [Stylophora pistillata]|uniref:uncharacterized protein LOC111346792 n=1 Tax=Stylophora pistillata TaxID=50429 RepID=UPI000C042AD1|nr:uncharacterized protein LOC111346792 [Stylophora pistillata]
MVAHSRILLSKCSEFRKEGELIEVRLKIGDTLFPAHRVVLASYSDYFHSILTDGKEANQEVMHHIMPSHEFAAEKVKPRSMSPRQGTRCHSPYVLYTASRCRSGRRRLQCVCFLGLPPAPQCMAHYFDVEAKPLWKPLPSVAQLREKTTSCLCAERSGNYLFVAGQKQKNEDIKGLLLGEINQESDNVIHRYDVVNNSWVKLPNYGKNHEIDSLCSIGDYIYAISESNPPQRYSLTDNSSQGGEGLNFIRPVGRGEPQRREELSTVSAAVMSSRVYVIHGYRKIEKDRQNHESWVDKPAVVHCFDPNYNVWTKIASTCLPHFESSLFVVNDRICVAGGKICKGRGDPAPVEVYHEGTNTWSVVPQKHIPPNDLGAVEIEGRVYFIINKFPVDSGIRIPPEEMFQVDLGGWEGLDKVSSE